MNEGVPNNSSDVKIIEITQTNSELYFFMVDAKTDTGHKIRHSRPTVSLAHLEKIQMIVAARKQEP